MMPRERGMREGRRARRRGRVHRFKVYLKPTDPAVIFGEMSFFESEAGPKAPITITTSNLGVLVEEAFLSTLHYANQRSIPFVWINDPGGLFPPSKRPAGVP